MCGLLDEVKSSACLRTAGTRGWKSVSRGKGKAEAKFCWGLVPCRVVIS